MEQESTTRQLQDKPIDLSLDQKAREKPVSAPLPGGTSAVFYLIFAIVQILAAIPLFMGYQNFGPTVFGYFLLTLSLLFAAVSLPFFALALRDGWSSGTIGKCCIALSILLCCWLTVGKF